MCASLEHQVLNVFVYRARCDARGISVRIRRAYRPMVTYPRSMTLERVKEHLLHTEVYEQQFQICTQPIKNPIKPYDAFYDVHFHFIKPTTLMPTSSITQDGVRVVSDKPYTSFSVQYEALYLLKALLKKKAAGVLPAIVAQEAQRLGLKYKRVHIKDTVSRYGSCSTLGNINLNAMLLLHSAESVRYVVLHELAHLTHMNHSPAFWSLLSDYLGSDAHEADLALHREPLPLPHLFPYVKP